MLTADAIQIMVDGGLDALAILAIARSIESPEPVRLGFIAGAGPISRIQAAAVDHFGLSMADMVSDRRARDVVRPRQIAMYLAKKMTDKSLPAIAAAFHRDHTTVMHAIRAVETRMAADPGVAADVAMIRLALTPVDNPGIYEGRAA